MVPGGEVVYLNAIKALAKVEAETDGDERTGARMLRRAMEEPLRQLAANAGLDGSVIIDGIRRAQVEKKSANWGYELISNKYVDMFEAGIIDPVKVTRSALENAGSIAGMILTTEALITDIPEKEKMSAMPPGGGMDY